jgi:hypothetical protein
MLPQVNELIVRAAQRAGGGGGGGGGGPAVLPLVRLKVGRLIGLVGEAGLVGSRMVVS